MTPSARSERSRRGRVDWARDVRALRVLLLVLTLIFGQAGLARPNFVRPSGELCRTCLLLPSEVAPARPSSFEPSSFDRIERRLAPAHGDCHDCCTLVAQTSPTVDAHSVDGGAFADYDAILPSATAVALPAPRPIRTPVALALAAHPPNGPPTLRASRAPPAPAIGLLPSAALL